MSKQEFLDLLREGLSGVPQEEIEERIIFYSEIIDDKTEEGLSEDEAISEIGCVGDIISQIIEEIPISKLVKEKVRTTKKLRLWEILLLGLGSPIWLSLLIAVFAVGLSVYISLWAVIVSLWSVFVSLIGSAFGGAVSGIALIGYGNYSTGLATIGCGTVCAGLSVFMFFGCKLATKGILLFTKKTVFGIKKFFVKKEDA